MPDKDDLDLLLDLALSTYAEPGPDAGSGANFDQRVLARIAAATSPERKHSPRRLWLPWAIALPLAAGLALLLFSNPKINHSSSAKTQLAHQSAPPPVRPRAGPPTETHSASARITREPTAPRRQRQLVQVANPAPLPKLDVFPTPQPMSAEERALVVVAVRSPLPLRKALAQAQQDDEPIHIAAIHIPPLESPDQGQP